MRASHKIEGPQQEGAAASCRVMSRTLSSRVPHRDNDAEICEGCGRGTLSLGVGFGFLNRLLCFFKRLLLLKRLFLCCLHLGCCFLSQRLSMLCNITRANFFVIFLPESFDNFLLMDL